MPHSQQRLKSLSVNGLRRIKNLFISFDDKNVTGIFGANGSGKTTLIYVLLCLYKSQGGIQYNFGSFFKRCKEHEFDKTKIIASVAYRNTTDVKNVDVTYKKSPGSDRWTPRSTNRPERDVYYFGISKCVPLIEEEIKVTSKYTFDDGNLVSEPVRKLASRILGIKYSMISHKRCGKKEQYFASIEDGSEYYSVSMGAGEQRVLRILEFFENIPKYALIIIDEIDLTLHTAALNKLLDYIVKISNDNHYQVVFTSHREELIYRTDINIRHLFQTPEDTLCFNETTPSCIDRLIGTTSRPIEIFVEDDLAETIVSICADKLEMRERVSIKSFGACTNAFVLSSALHILGNDLSNMLFVLDGDRYKTDNEKLDQIKKHYSGNELEKEAARKQVLKAITSFNLPEGKTPEKFINDTIGNDNPTSNSELQTLANEIIEPIDSHDYINILINKMGDSRPIGLYKIITEFSKHEEWSNYVASIIQWLHQKKDELLI